MTEQKKIESAIRAGCNANSVGWICLYPRCQESAECDMRQTAIAAIRAYLVASREPSEAMMNVCKNLAVVSEIDNALFHAQNHGIDYAALRGDLPAIVQILHAGRDAQLAEFDAAAAEMQKARP